MFAAGLEGRDAASEKRAGKRRLTTDRVEEVVALYDQKHLAGKRSRNEIKQLLDRVVVSAWRGRSLHEIGKADGVDGSRSRRRSAKVVLSRSTSLEPPRWRSRLSASTWPRTSFMFTPSVTRVRWSNGGL